MRSFSRSASNRIRLRFNGLQADDGVFNAVRVYAVLHGIQDLNADEFSLSIIVHDDARFIFDAFLTRHIIKNDANDIDFSVIRYFHVSSLQYRLI